MVGLFSLGLSLSLRINFSKILRASLGLCSARVDIKLGGLALVVLLICRVRSAFLWSARLCCFFLALNIFLVWASVVFLRLFS